MSGQKREAVKRYLLNHWDGERTQKEVAEDLGVSNQTVGRAVQDLKESGKDFQLEKISPERFSKSQKQQQVRDYLNNNPDASN